MEFPEADGFRGKLTVGKLITYLFFKELDVRRRLSDMVEKDLVGKLEAELEKLKHLLGLSHHLRVKWIPNNHGKLSGEVRGDCILHL